MKHLHFYSYCILLWYPEVNMFQELVSSNTNQRNWRGILIALLVIVVVLALIVTSVVLLTPPDDGPRIKGTRFKLQDIISRDFQPLRFNGTWVSGGCRQKLLLTHIGCFVNNFRYSCIPVVLALSVWFNLLDNLSAYQLGVGYSVMKEEVAVFNELV